jgi:Spy/CpxP family protein refolding chaperone
MKKHLFSRMIVVVAVAVLIGSGVNAFAGMGKGAGNPGMCAANANLTDDQIKKMESERTAFLLATKDIRQQIHDKRQALQAELAKQTPDALTCATIQKEISDIQSQFDQKRLTHILEMKKVDPNFTDGKGMGRSMGHGMGSPSGGGPPN